MLGIVAGNPERLHGGRDVAVVDLGRAHLLRTLPGSVLSDVPAVRTFEDLHLAQNAERIDTATGTAASGAQLDIAGALIGDFLNRRIDRDDLRNQAAREFGAEPAA